MSALLPARLFDPAPDPQPARIGKYLVTDVIGEGAMGVVYRGTDPLIQRPVAIKTIRPELLATRRDGFDAAARFRQEAQAAGRLQHPNIVSVYEYGETEQGHYLAMECVEGRSLHAITGCGARLAMGDVVAVMLQLLDALHAAHEQRVWHCDIKPSNLLVTREGRLKVSDFGIARIDAADGMVRGAVLGSPGYMAPERYRRETADHRVDIFACGVLLYELLTGVAPFAGPREHAMTQVLEHEPAPPSGQPGSVGTPALDAVVARAIAKRAADRYPSAQAMRDALLDAVPAEAARTVLSPAALVHMRRAGTGSQPSMPAAAPVTVGAPTWDAALLSRVERLLQPHLGPAAAAVVRDASRRSSNLPSLVSRIAGESLGREARTAFLAGAQRLTGVAPPPPTRRVAVPPPPPPPAAVPVLGGTPMDPKWVDDATRVLARRMGPIARVMARRAAEAATSREQFYCLLADRAGGDTKALLAELWQGA